MGAPFETCHLDGKGLSLPNLKFWLTFICEACTVQSVLGQKLIRPTDWKLLCFEQMRMLDVFHFWSSGTHAKYQGKLDAMRLFETKYDLPMNDGILRMSQIKRPP